MFFLGLLAIVQMAFLPGFLLVYGLRLCRGPARILTTSFSLSALLNFFLVASCLLLGIYTALALYIVIAAETLLLLYLLRRRGVFRPLLEDPTSGSTASLAATDGAGALRAPHVFHLLSNPQQILVPLALAVVALSCSEVFLRLGDTFVLDDALNSWNRWAMRMATNEWPARTLTYPQLLPANYSIAYVVTGNRMMWPFAKAWISCSLPVLLLGLCLLFRDEGRWEIALAVPFTAWLFYRVMGPPFVYGGIADIALATFAFQAVAALLRAGPQREAADSRRELLLGALFAVACALTKQGGLLLLIVYPLLVWTMAGSGGEPVRRRSVRQWLLLSAPLMLLVVVPWYVPDWIRSASTKDSVLALQVIDCHEGRDAVERVLHALHLLAGKTSWWAVALMGALMPLSLAVRRYRAILAAVVIPYFLCWGLGFSYDHRNSAMLLPFLALVSAIGVGVAWTGIRHAATAIPGVTPARARFGAVILLGVATLAALDIPYTARRLAVRHNRARRETTGIPALNRELRRHLRETGLGGQILTTYKTMKWVPGLDKRWYPVEISRASGLETYLEHLALSRVRFVLFDSFKTPPEVTRYLEAGESTGEFEKVFEMYAGRFVMYRKLCPPRPETAAAADRRDPAQGEPQ